MNSQPQTRREFLKAATRAALLGVAGLLGLELFCRRGTRGGCSGCKLSESCALPWKEAKR